MKRKTVAIIISVFSGAALLSGCAQTPEDSIIKQKGASSLKNYEEAETLTAGEKNDSSVQDNTGDNSINDSTENAAQNALRATLNAPERYQSEISDDTGKLQIFTDADVEIPDADKVSAISVSQHPFDQTVMDRITDTFFPDAAIYSGDSYYQMTKEDYQKRIEELKGYVAEGNLDPYDFGTDENGAYYYDIYQDIENAEQSYEAAPESKTLVEVHPQYGLEVDDGQGGTYVLDDYFDGVAVTADGAEYSYIMKSYNGMPMDVEIRKIHRELGDDMMHGWTGDYKSMKADNPQVPDEEEVKEAAGITLEEAKAIADEKVAKLNLDHMELTEWGYGLCWGGEGGFTREGWVDTGYILHYKRSLNGIPITYTEDMGGNLEDMDSEMETWGYEILDITVTKDGIDTVLFCNQYDIGDVKTENLKLLSFDEIIKIYEKMMLIQNADILNYESERAYNIDRITFGYTRIYEPSSDSTTGLLVPAWDFFGSFESHAEYDGEQYDTINAMQYQSYITINAVDGSIIDRGLGY